MTWSALPDHLNTPEEVEAAFPDDSDHGPVFRWIKKHTKHWLAFGPRATEWWARFRETPVVLFAFRGRGVWRWEVDGGLDQYTKFPVFDTWVLKYYMSRQQLWARWHIQLQWPLFFACHWYNRQRSVLKYPYKQNRDGKLWFFYCGFKRDPDCYWLSFYAGRNWK